MLILEGGSGLNPNANSYATVAEADAYFTLFNNLDWLAQPEEIKEVALINATNAIDLLFGQRYLSAPVYSDQPLLYPRFTFIINDTQYVAQGFIPVQLKKAVYETAYLNVQDIDIYPAPNPEAGVTNNRIKIDAIEIENTYGVPASTEQYANFNKIELILAPLLKNTSNGTIAKRMSL
jgi:hypothetical protein